MVPVLMIAASALVLAGATDLSILWARVGAILAVGAVAAHLARQGRPDLMLSPLFLLSVQSLGFFVLVPWLLIDLAAVFFHSTALYGEYLGSHAERLVLAGATMLAATLVPLVKGTVPLPAPLLSVGTSALMIVAALALAAALPLLSGARAGGGYLLRQGLDAVPPVLAFTVALLHMHFLSRPRMHTLFMAVVIIIAAALVGLGQGKLVFMLLGAMLLSWLMFSPTARRLKAAILVVSALVIALGLGVFGYVRDTGSADRPGLSTQILRGFSEKVVIRQLQTGWCLKNVIDQHGTDGGMEQSSYFLAGLVPGALWPDKPSLSTGREFGMRYCGIDEIFVTHSASITLLGEPVTKAGWGGLAIAMAALLGGLASLTAIAFRTGGVGMAAIIAMTPWLVNFDQSFAMYVANGVKVLMIGLVVILLAAWPALRQRRSSCAE